MADAAISSHKYLVLLRPDVHLQAHLDDIGTRHDGESLHAVGHVNITNLWEFPGFSAYAGYFSDVAVGLLHGHHDVSVVEQDIPWRACADVASIEIDEQNSCNLSTCPAQEKLEYRIQRDAPYNLAQISHRLPRNAQHFVYSGAAGVHTYAYVLDSGINEDNVEFGGRVQKGFNAIPSLPFDDEWGHGTMVAGIIAGRTYGVGKRINIIDVKVMDHRRTLTSTVIEGFRWAVRDIVRQRSAGRSVINVSLGPDPVARSQALNTAVKAAYDNGITTVLASGHDDVPAECPDGAICVGSTGRALNRKYNTPYGPKIDIFAPGTLIKSASIGGRRAIATESGTSFAAAHVSGVICTLKSETNLPDAVLTRRVLLQVATRGILGELKGSPNVFLYNNSGR